MVQSGGMHGLASLDPYGLSAAVGRPGLRGRRETARGLCGPRRRGGGRRGPGRAALSLLAGLVPRQHGLSVGLHSLRPARDVSALVGDRPGLRTGGCVGSGGRCLGFCFGFFGCLVGGVGFVQGWDFVGVVFVVCVVVVFFVGCGGVVFFGCVVCLVVVVVCFVVLVRFCL